MRSIVITSAVRTPIGRMGGAIKDVLPEELASITINEAVYRSGITGEMLDEIIIGQTKQSADAPNIARVAALRAGLPEEIPAYTVHRQCSSGMQAILNAAWQIQADYGDIILAGGVESMSSAPFYLRKARFGYEAGNGELLDSNTESQPKSQPEEIYGRITMGITAENLADKYGISRGEQDEFSYISNKKAIDAIDRGIFEEEIVSVQIKNKKEAVYFSKDEHPRRDTSIEKLSRLKPVFKENGTVTAGNSSGRNDGSSAMIVMSEDKAQELGIKPLVRIVSAGISGVNPSFMGIGPVPATKMALQKSGLKLEEIGLIELNEAFAAQCLAVVKELNIDMSKLNVNGGAIALGHPLGCSGARICTTLIHEMVRRGVRYGLATICVAGGLGVSVIFENLNQ